MEIDKLAYVVVGAIISLVSTLATAFVSHLLAIHRERIQRRRTVLETLGRIKERKGEFTTAIEYHTTALSVNNLNDDVLAVWLGALKEQSENRPPEAANGKPKDGEQEKVDTQSGT
jgi:hypothetical protein